MPTIETIKERAQAQTPIVVFDITFPDGTVKYFATNAVTFGGHLYEARVLAHNISGVQSMNETGLDLPPTAQFELADADTEMTQLQNTLGFKGASVVSTFLIMDAGTQVPASSDSIIRFVGTCNNPQDMSEGGSRGPSLTITAQNQFTAQRQQIPPFVLGRLCFHNYPVTADQRLDGAINRNSRFYGCGYSSDVPLADQPVGSLNSGVPFTTCNHSRQDCIARGMFFCDTATALASSASIGATSISINDDVSLVGTDIVVGGNPDAAQGYGDLVQVTGKSGSGPYTYTISPALKKAHSSGANVGRYTARFSGNEFVPLSYLVKPYGGKLEQAPVASAQYGDAIPLPYGHVWVNAKTTALRGDGNNQRLECVASLGEIDSIVRVVVNGYEIPRGTGQGGTGNTTTGFFDILTMGSRTGGFDLSSFTDSNGNPQGDPYGSMAALEIVVPKAIASGSNYPQVRVEVTGRLIETYDSGGASTGWAYNTDPCLVFIDALKLCRFPLAKIDTAFVANTSSPICDAIINTLDDFGNTVSDQRFHFAYVLDRQIPGAQFIQGIRNNARLYVNWVAGKLRINVENTIAIEQPTKPVGSNASGTISGGWPAYSFDETNIIRRNGNSTFRRYFKDIPQTQTKITFDFFDQWNGYVQDTFNLNDTDEQALVGFDVPASSLVFGSPAWDQSARIGAFMLAKSVEGNDYAELESSVKVVETQLGQIVAVSYVKESMTNVLYRIIKIEPAQNFRQSKLTLQFHDDAWYADTYGGTVRAPIGKPWFDRGARAPWPVHGNVSPPVSGNVLDKPQYDSREVEPHVSAESVITNADGSVAIQIAVTAAGPPLSVSPTVQPPIIDAQCTVLSSGGSLPATTLYYAVATIDIASGARSHRSTTAIAVIPSGSTNRAQINGIKLPSGAAATMVVYRGRTPQTMIGREVTSATTFIDDGTLGWSESPYDPFFDHPNFYWRNVDSGSMRVAPSLTNIFSSTTIGNAAKAWTVNQFAGCVVEIVRGSGAGQRRYITSNTATTLTVPAWQVTPSISSAFCVYSLCTSATSTTIADSAAAWPSLANKVVKVIDGTGVYQERRVVSNTGIQATIDAPWDTVPNSTSAFEFADASWSAPVVGASVYGGYLATAFQGSLTVPNSTNALIEYVLVSADAQNQESMIGLGSFARYAVLGNNPMPPADVVTGFSIVETPNIAADGTVTSQLVATFTPPSPLGTWAGVELYAAGDGASGHYSTGLSLIGAGTASPITMILPCTKETITITAYSFNTDGALNTTAGPTTTVILDGQTTSPTAPTGLTESTGILTAGQVLLAWDANSTNKDLASCDIARRYDATAPSATDIINSPQSVYQNPATRKQTYIDTPGANTAQARYYVRWVNTSGLFSAWTGPALVTVLAPDGSTDTGVAVIPGSTYPASSGAVIGGVTGVFSWGSPPTTYKQDAGSQVIELFGFTSFAGITNWSGVETIEWQIESWDDINGTVGQIVKRYLSPLDPLKPCRFVAQLENRYVKDITYRVHNYYGWSAQQSIATYSAPLSFMGSQSQDNSIPSGTYDKTTQQYGFSKLVGNTSNPTRQSNTLSDPMQEWSPIDIRADQRGVLMVTGAAPAVGDIVTTKDVAGVKLAYMLPVGSNGKILTADSGVTGGIKWGTGGAGTITSITMIDPGSGFTISPTTVSTGGATFTCSWAGSPIPTSAIPPIDLTSMVSNILPTANGGTGIAAAGILDSKHGTRACQFGVGTLSAGTATITASGMTTILCVFAFVAVGGTSTETLNYGGVSGGTFTIWSSNVLSTNSFSWLVFGT